MGDDTAPPVSSAPVDPAAPRTSPEGRNGKPEAPDWLIDNIAELSKNTRSLYLLYIGSLAYYALTVVGTSDRQMLLDESVRLPLIGVEVALAGFFVIAPLLAIGTFVYLQLYLQELTTLKRQLRENYQPVASGRLYPWILNVVDASRPGTVGWLQRMAVRVVLWGLLPVVLFLFAFWYLQIQDPLAGAVIVLLPAVGIAAVLFFWHAYEPRGDLFGTDLRNDRGKLGVLAIGGALQVFLGLVFIQLVLPGRMPPDIGGLTTIDVRFQSLITESRYNPYWVDLRGKRLNGANMTDATLIKADLREAQLQGAHLSGARLDSANLGAAQMQGADLGYAQLQGANLHRTRLDSADLGLTKFQGADLGYAQLKGANLGAAQMQGADLEYAHLQWAYLGEAQLQGADLSGAQLQGADLSEAQLQGADLNMVGMQDADLRGTRLDSAVVDLVSTISNIHIINNRPISLNGTIISNASLKGLRCMILSTDTLFQFVSCSENRSCRNTIVNALCGAKSLEGISTDPEILDGIRRKCPALLEGQEAEASQATNRSVE